MLWQICLLLLHISLAVIGPDGKEIHYYSPANVDPLRPVFGSMKASHRALDPSLTRIDSPVFLHTKEAVKKLTPGEIAECPVPTFPAAFYIPKGSRLVLRVSPVSPRFVSYDSYSYRPGSTNTLYYGEDHPSYLQLPVLPIYLSLLEG